MILVNLDTHVWVWQSRGHEADRAAHATAPDPLDRLLVATAHHLDATIVTSDVRILDYPTIAGGPPVHNARL